MSVEVTKMGYEGPEGLLWKGGSFLSPRDFFEEIVSPNVDLFLQDQGSKQFAFNAAIGLYHMVDYICEFAKEHKVTWFPDAGKAGIQKYREKLIACCPEFEVAEAVALVYKHYSIGHTRAKKVASSIVSVHREVTILESNNLGNDLDTDVTTVFAINFAKPYRAKEQIIVKSDDGRTHVLSDIFIAVRDMWWNELNHIGMDAKTRFDLKSPSNG